MTLPEAVVSTALLFSWVSFATFFCVTIYQLTVAKDAHNTVKDTKPLSGSDAVPAVDIAKWLESAAKLVDSLTKAGPGLSALAAAILFLSIAAYGTQEKQAASESSPAATGQGAKSAK